MSLRGSCECGQVTFELNGPLRDVIFCHCSQCRKTSGHHWAATRLDQDNLVFMSDATLKWYRSSDAARRGFCGACGSSLFYRRDNDSGIAVAAGALDGPTGLGRIDHIFTGEKGDYYEITDGLPQFTEWRR